MAKWWACVPRLLQGGWYISDGSAPSTYTCSALEIFRFWPDDDMPCMGNTWNTEKVLAHFLLQECWRWVAKIPFCMWSFCLIREGKTSGSQLGLWKADLELVGLNAIPAKWHALRREALPVPASGISHRAACVCSWSPGSGLSPSLMEGD